MGNGLGCLENDVTGEPIADHDFGRILKQIVSFDVASKIESTSFEQFKGFLGYVVAFAVLFADRHQGNGRIAVTKSLSGKD